MKLKKNYKLWCNEKQFNELAKMLEPMGYKVYGWNDVTTMFIYTTEPCNDHSAMIVTCLVGKDKKYFEDHENIEITYEKLIKKLKEKDMLWRKGEEIRNSTDKRLICGIVNNGYMVTSGASFDYGYHETGIRYRSEESLLKEGYKEYDPNKKEIRTVNMKEVCEKFGEEVHVEK